MNFLSDEVKEIQSDWVWLLVVGNLGLAVLGLIPMIFNLTTQWCLMGECASTWTLYQPTAELLLPELFKKIVSSALLYWTVIRARKNWLLIGNLILTPFMLLREAIDTFNSPFDELIVLFLTLDFVFILCWYVISVRMIRANRAYHRLSIKVYQTCS